MNHCKKRQVEKLEYSGTLLANNTSVYDFTANDTCGIRQEYDAESAKKSVSILLTFANPVFPDTSYPANSIIQTKMNTFDHSNMVKNIKILGLMALISYMIVILFTWLFANIEGYVYFSAGEPVQLIKYLEWALGLLGIFVAFNYLQKELNEYNI